MMVWIEFFVLASAITFFGYQLSKLGDQISDLTGLGRNLIGLILLSSVTSLPELVTGISSVRIAENPNLAIGDIMGSCCFNLATVVLLDVFYKEGSVYSRSTQSHLLMAILGIVLIAFTGVCLVLKDISFGYLSIYSYIIPILYFVSIRAVYIFEKEDSSHHEKVEGNLKIVLLKFATSAVFIVVLGTLLPQTAEKIIHLMEWNSAFVGTFFVALTTSLPEISVTISALRINAAELGFSNLLGSNIFNFMILAVDDVFYKKGPLLAAADETHVVTTFSALLMTGIVALALLRPPEKKFFNVISGFSMLMIGIYILNLFVSFRG